MSNNRIRYRKTRQEGVLESVQRFNHPTSGARYKVLLNLTEHKWMVVDDNSDIVAASGLRTHQHKLKIDAKEALMKLGVEFTLESRNTKGKLVQVQSEETITT